MFKQQIINKVAEKYIELIKKHSKQFQVELTDVKVGTAVEMRPNAEQKQVLMLVHFVEIRGERKEEFKLDDIV